MFNDVTKGELEWVSTQKKGSTNHLLSIFLKSKHQLEEIVWWSIFIVLDRCKTVFEYNI